jgi:hypothetical protein
VWRETLLRLLAQVCLIVPITLLIVRWSITRPIHFSTLTGVYTQNPVNVAIPTLPPTSWKTLPDIMLIADEVDSRLKQSIDRFLVQGRAVEQIEFEDD